MSNRLNLPNGFANSMNITAQMANLQRMAAALDHLAPGVHAWFKGMPNEYLAFEIVVFVAVFIVGLMTMKMMRDVITYIDDESYRNDVALLICAPLFICIFCMLGNVFVRSASILYAISLTYVVICLYRLVELLFAIFGGTDEFSKWLIAHDRKVTFGTRILVCLKFIPGIEPTPRTLNILKLLVLQTPMIRITIQIALLIMILEGVHPTSAPPLVLSIIAVVSTITGIYTTHMMFRMTEEFLWDFGMTALFRSMDVCQGLITLMKFIFEILGKKKVFNNAGPLPSQAVAQYWFNVAMCFACILVCLVQMIFTRPGKCALFDPKFLKKIIAQRYSASMAAKELKEKNGIDEKDLDIDTSSI